MSIFDIKKLADINNVTLDISSVSSDCSSYFGRCLDFNTIISDKLLDQKRNLYTAPLKDINNPLLVTEAHHDLFISFSQIINRFIKFIKNLIDKFINKMRSLGNRDSFILNNIENLKEFDKEFKIEGYNYSITTEVPAIDTLMYTSEFIDILDSVDYKLKDEYYNHLEKLNKGLLDINRGFIIGKRKGITKPDFGNELFKVYRSDKDSASSIKIDSKAVGNSLDRYLNFRSLDIVKSQRDNIIKNYQQLEKVIYKGVSTIDNEYGELLLKNKLHELEEIMIDHTAAFGAKLDAIKELYSQDRTILYNAVKKIDEKEVKYYG